MLNLFAKHLASSFKLDGSRRLDGGVSLRPNEQSIISITQSLQRAFGGDLFRLQGASLEPFLATLSVIIAVDDAKIEYMRKLLQFFERRVSCIATLNYDRVVERSCETANSKFDLGLGQWNEKRVVKFHGKSLKLIKLHGSVDWYLRNEDEIVFEPSRSGAPLRRAMIFGGQGEKLVPHGPFLHLRHEFQKFLSGSSSLLIAGYSFRDSHLNAIIRSWVATRNKAQMMVVDPEGFPTDHAVMRYSKDRIKSRYQNSSVQLNVVKKKVADAYDEINHFLSD